MAILIDLPPNKPKSKHASRCSNKRKTVVDCGLQDGRGLQSVEDVKAASSVQLPRADEMLLTGSDDQSAGHAIRQ
jgi:hypothetical protein